jgi:hypothetical protein
LIVIRPVRLTGLFERLRGNPEKRCRDPEGTNLLEVRRLETEREEQRLPPRMRFLEKLQSTAKKNDHGCL